MNTAHTDAILMSAPRVARFELLAYGLFLHRGLYSQLGRGEWMRHLKEEGAAGTSCKSRAL